MTNFIPIRYNIIWALLYITVGVICSLLFVFASFYLNDLIILTYSIASIPPIYIGYILYTTPYAKITKKSIIVFGLFGQTKHVYKFDSNNQPYYKKNRFYLRIDGKENKIKMNKWFINSNDWIDVIDLFDNVDSKKVIKHLITD